MDNRPIGVFDSGVGGISVLYELQKSMPNEKYIFFGDTKNVPYGEKTSEEIIELSKKIVSFLMIYNVKLCVIACNSISSTALNELENSFDVKFISITKSGIKSATNKNFKKVCVIATNKTIQTNVYEEEMKKIQEDLDVYNIPTPELAIIVEKGLINTKISNEYVQKYLGNLKNDNVDALILGCTHYPFLIEEIKLQVGNTEIINPNMQCAVDIKNYLDKNNLNGNNETDIKFFVTGDVKKFASVKNKYVPNFNNYEVVKQRC